MNSRMTEFVAAVMGFALEIPTCARGTAGGGWRARASCTAVSSHAPETSPAWDISHGNGLTTTQIREESLLKRWSRVPPPLSFDTKCKNQWSYLLGSGTWGRGRERSHLVSHVGLS